MTSASVNTIVNETLAYPFPGRIRDGTSSDQSRRRRVGSRENRDWMNVSVLTPICSRGRSRCQLLRQPDIEDLARGLLRTKHVQKP
jgi:hypothetical protein